MCVYSCISSSVGLTHGGVQPVSHRNTPFPDPPLPPSLLWSMLSIVLQAKPVHISDKYSRVDTCYKAYSSGSTKTAWRTSMERQGCSLGLRSPFITSTDSLSLGHEARKVPRESGSAS